MKNYFSKNELSCGCGCGFNHIEATILRVANGLRKYLGYALPCSSGCRCPEHNKNEGGADESSHLPWQALSAVCVESTATIIDGNDVEIDCYADGLFDCDSVMAGHAMDLKIPMTERARSIQWLLDHHPHISIGVYDWGLHIDSRYLRGEMTKQWGSL